MSEHVQEHGIRNPDNHSSPAALAETGILTGGEMTGTIGTGVYNVAAGTGYITDYTDPLNPITTEVSWNELLNTPVSGTDFHTVYVDDTGTIQKKDDATLTAQERRENIRLGFIINVGGTVTQEINTNPIPAYNTMAGFYDWLRAVGGQVNGSNLIFNNADLTFEQASGNYTFPFVNYANDKMNPSVISNPTTDPASFFQQYEDGVGGFTTVALTTLVDPDQYDDGSGTLAALANNKHTFKPVYYFGSTNTISMVYGQIVYNSQDEAVSGILKDFNSMVINPILTTGLLLGFIVVKKGTTDLTNATDFTFVASNQVAGGGVSGGTNPGGSDTQVQFNDAGSFGGDADLIWDKTGKKLSINGQLLVANGTQALPSVAFINDPDTGMYRSAANQLDLVSGGSLALRIDSSQNVLMGKTATGSSNEGAEWDEAMKRFLSTTAGATQTSIQAYATHATYVGSVFVSVALRAGNSAFNLALFSSNNGVDTEFKFRGDGEATADGSWTGGGADRAEYMEWEDGNPRNEDRSGFTVVNIGNQMIRQATQRDKDNGMKIFAISSNPDSVGNAAPFKWRGKYLRNYFGAYDLDKKGDRKLSRGYKEKSKYVPRSNRREWITVTLSGFTRVRTDQVISEDWIEQSDITNKIKEYLV